MKLIPFDFDHMDIFEQKPEDILRYGEVTSETPNPLAEYGVAFTAIDDGRIVCVGGILASSNYTGKCWTMVSKYGAGSGLRLLRLVKRQLEAMMKDMKIHRIETANLVDAHEHHRWCKLLGFQEEGLMRYYDDEKRDYLRFAKFMED